MDTDESLALIKSNNTALWRQYRSLHPEWIPDLAEVDFENASLEFFDFSNAILWGSNLSKAAVSYQSDTGSVYELKLTNAQYDIRTKFPPKFDAVKAGARFVPRKEREMLVRGRSRVFISYAHIDGAVVRAIDQWLWSKGLETQIDERDFFAGSELKNEIMRVISECDVVLAIYSAASSSRPWPLFEREFADKLSKERQLQGKVPPKVIYAAIDGTPLPATCGSDRLNVLGSGRPFSVVCEEIYSSILRVPRMKPEINLEKWSSFVFP